MDIHKPKPWHGWREFAKEYGIIVLGVLTALAAEQLVEWIHWNHEVAEARQALDQEAAYNLGAVVMRQKEAPCIDSRLGEIRALLARADFHGLPAGAARLGQPQLWRPRTNVWQATLTGQVADHMPLEMRIDFAKLYDGFQWYGQKAADETEAWGVLGELDDPGVLGPQEIATLREARARAQAAADKMNANLPRILDTSAKAGIAPGAVDERPLTAQAREALCRPLTATAPAGDK